MRGGGNISPYLTTILRSLKYSQNAINKGVTAGLEVEKQMKVLPISHSNFGQRIRDISSAAIKAAEDAAKIVKEREDKAAAEEKAKANAEAAAAREAATIAIRKEMAKVAGKEAAVEGKKRENTKTIVAAVRGTYQTKQKNLQRELNELTHQKTAENSVRKPSFFGRFLGRSQPVSNA